MREAKQSTNMRRQTRHKHEGGKTKHTKGEQGTNMRGKQSTNKRQTKHKHEGKQGTNMKAKQSTNMKANKAQKKLTANNRSHSIGKTSCNIGIALFLT
jgi:hypothetical protein